MGLAMPCAGRKPLGHPGGLKGCTSGVPCEAGACAARKMPDLRTGDPVPARRDVAAVPCVHYNNTMQHDDDLDTRIGARIRAERESRGWSLTDLAQRASVSRAMIHKIERGASSPTAHLLGKLSGAFGLSMSTLMARAEMQQGRLLRHEDQPVWSDPETGYVRRHVSPRTDLPMDVVEVSLLAGTDVAMPASAFALQRQLIWVLEGELVFVEGPVRHDMQAGDCLELGPPMECVFRNQSARSCRYVVMVLRGTGVRSY